jgi:hypothetical protein
VFHDEEHGSDKRVKAHATETLEMDECRILDFAGKMLPHSGESWRRMNAGQRQVPQKAIFPAGIRFYGRNS